MSVQAVVCPVARWRIKPLLNLTRTWTCSHSCYTSFQSAWRNACTVDALVGELVHWWAQGIWTRAQSLAYSPSWWNVYVTLTRVDFGREYPRVVKVGVVDFDAVPPSSRQETEICVQSQACKWCFYFLIKPQSFPNRYHHLIWFNQMNVSVIFPPKVSSAAGRYPDILPSPRVTPWILHLPQPNLKCLSLINVHVVQTPQYGSRRSVSIQPFSCAFSIWAFFTLGWGEKFGVSIEAACRKVPNGKKTEQMQDDVHDACDT